MLKIKTAKKYSIILAVILMMAMIFTSCGQREDDNPPTAPLLTIVGSGKDAVELAWSESYDDEGIDTYKLYKNDEVLAEVSKTEYKDKEVTVGEEYEYYVVAYDESGNRSSKSVKQRVKVPDGTAQTQIQAPNQTKKNETEEPLNIQKLSKSTVKMYLLDDELNILGSGSGTILNKEGYILTNYHVVADEKGLYNSEGLLAVAITEDVKKNIQPQYIAQFRSGVEELDLAVVKIITDLNWNEVSSDDLNLIPAKIADSDNVQLGDTINILGYPGVGGETITFTSGTVSGFLDDNNDSEVDWIKTDAFVNHGNSGGTAVNQSGQMVGVPTAKQTGQDNDIMFYLKPVNQALPIVKDALAKGDNPVLPNPNPTPEPAQSEMISVYGRLVDAYTNKPIPGAAFVVLKQDITIEQFSADPKESMVLSYAETDRDGIFALYNIPVGGLYPVIIGADGYTSYVEDGALEIPADWQGDMDIGDVSLEKSN